MFWLALASNDSTGGYEVGNMMLPWGFISGNTWPRFIGGDGGGDFDGVCVSGGADGGWCLG